MGHSLAEVVSEQWIDDLTPAEAAALEYDWSFWGRPEQQAPDGSWGTWAILSGRGWGKTRCGAEWVKRKVEEGARHIALVGATSADVRDTMIEGESGLLSVFPEHQRPRYIPSKRRVVFHTGAYATCFTAEKPDRIRGPNITAAWCDELAAWDRLEDAWSNLDMTMRLPGMEPQKVITTTPRPLDILRDLVRQAENDTDVRITEGTTWDNLSNLHPKFIRRMRRDYEGTRLGQQELYGRILEPIGVLFRPEWIRRCPPPERLQRVVVAIDPAISTRNDETGIVAVGRIGDHAYVLEDLSGLHTPDEWARLAVQCRDRWRKRAAFVELFAEVNRGGDLVKATLRQMDPLVAVKEDRAFKGKDTRAEPCAALYEQHRVHHCGEFSKLEDQMLTFDPTGQDELRKRKKATSPDRLDALVWAVKRLGFHRHVPAYRKDDFTGPQRSW